MCVECGVRLVDQVPTSPEALAEREPVQLAYELHEWSFEARRMVDQLLTAHPVVHAWQGATLLVLEAHEAAVDEVIDQVEASVLPTLDPAAEQTAYDMDGWDEVQRARLTDRLELSGVPHQLTAVGELVVHRADESEVDRLIDEVSAALAAGPVDDPIDLDGLGTNELLTQVFVSADKLRRNPRDTSAIVALVDDAATVARLRTPFGLDTDEWAATAGRIAALAALFDEEAGDLDDDQVSELASTVRVELSRMV